MASGVLGVAIRSSTIPGFESFLRSLNPYRQPDDRFLREFWGKVFGCSPAATPLSSYAPSQRSGENTLLQGTSLPRCNGTESLEGVQHPFTYTSELRVTYNVYLAVYAAAHALHNLLSCPNRDTPPGNNSSTCTFPKHIKPIEVTIFNMKC